MAGRKPRKSTGRKRITGKKKKNFLIPVIIAGIVLQTVVAAFILLVIKPYPSTDEKGGEITEKATPFSYEEPGLPNTVVGVEPGDKKHPPEKKLPVDNMVKSGGKPMLAIVIDDMGYKLKTGKGLLALDLALSFAFLPSGPHLDTLARKANKKGRDVLVHIPLEPADGGVDPGPGALFISMSEATMRSRFEKNLAALPLARGVNNHMGSRFTQNREAMKIFLEMVRENDLYFLDSMTSRNSVGHIMAREMGIKTARRHVFLDNERDVRKIKKQLRHLLAVAEKSGLAIGIGHPYPETLTALKDMQAEIKKRARLAGVSRMVR